MIPVIDFLVKPAPKRLCDIPQGLLARMAVKLCLLGSLALARLLPEFAGDCYDRDSASRRITAGIICNEIKQVDIYDDNGKI